MAKGILNLAVVGHVDHGKSTLVGHLFHECGQIPDRQLERLQRQAAALGQPSLQFAFFTDTSLEERRRGISIEVAYRGLETRHHRLNVIDVPGHKDFMRNTISGMWAADAAVLVVDARALAGDGLPPQAKEHVILLKALEVAHLVVAVNKMDAVGFSQEAFDLCRLEVEQCCDALDYGAGTQATYIPISATQGDNLTQLSPYTPWYRGAPVLDALDAIPSPSRPSDRPLRVPLLRTFSVRGVGPVVTGTIESGRVAPGDRVVIVPYLGTGWTGAEVKSIEWQHQQVAEASPGEDVGILLTRPEKNFLARQVKKGAVLGSPAAPPRALRRFKAELRVIDHPSGLRPGYTPFLHLHQAAVPCRLMEVLKAHNRHGEGKPSDEEPRLANGDTGVVWLETEKPLVIERAADYPRLGRFVLREGRTVAIGQCLETNAVRS
jgi:elongation factor 1-alpha